MALDEIKNAITQLRKDLKHNLAEAEGLDEGSKKLLRHLSQTLWPFLDGALDVVEDLALATDEIDDAVVELVEQNEDFLQPETAALIAGTLQAGMAISQEMRARLDGKGQISDDKLREILDAHDALCGQVADTVGAATVGDADDDDTEEGDDEDEVHDA